MCVTSQTIRVSINTSSINLRQRPRQPRGASRQSKGALRPGVATESLVGVLHATVVTATRVALLAPARHLFLLGPSALGCWHGRPLADVCAGITGVRAPFWESPDAAAECAAIIDTHVWAYLVPLYVGVYFVGILTAARKLVNKVWSHFEKFI